MPIIASRSLKIRILLHFWRENSPSLNILPTKTHHGAYLLAVAVSACAGARGFGQIVIGQLIIGYPSILIALQDLGTKGIQLSLSPFNVRTTRGRDFAIHSTSQK